jgi:hypothetical protein
MGVSRGPCWWRCRLTANQGGNNVIPSAGSDSEILSQARRLLDFTRPVAVTLLDILHAIPDADDPHAIVCRSRCAGELQPDTKRVRARREAQAAPGSRGSHERAWPGNLGHLGWRRAAH